MFCRKLVGRDFLTRRETPEMAGLFTRFWAPPLVQLRQKLIVNASSNIRHTRRPIKLSRHPTNQLRCFDVFVGQIDDLDEQLRQEQETSRRLRSAVSVLERKLEAAEEGRRRSNGLERAFFGHLAEAEALVLQRDRLMTPGRHLQYVNLKWINASRNGAFFRPWLILYGEVFR